MQMVTTGRTPVSRNNQRLRQSIGQLGQYLIMCGTYTTLIGGNNLTCKQRN